MKNRIARAMISTLVFVSISAGATENLDLNYDQNLKLDVVAKVKNARQLSLGGDGTLYVSTRSEGKIWALKDLNNDGFYEKSFLLAEGLNLPTGITYHRGDLYLAEVGSIYRIKNIEGNLIKPRLERLEINLPNIRHHGWKYLKVGPDGMLYFNIGAPCNICLSESELMASIVRTPLEGGVPKVVANGVRNSVGFDWHEDGSLWFTDNGRDMMGDDIPDDELNRLVNEGEHFGYPFIHAGTVSDPAYGAGHSPEDYKHPALKLGAHVAPLGITFYKTDKKQIPDADENTLFLAEHGSWNRSEKVGYRVMQIQTLNGKVIGEKVLIDGWLSKSLFGGESVSGRPVDILVDQEGALLISDDHAGVIYKLEKRN